MKATILLLSLLAAVVLVSGCISQARQPTGGSAANAVTISGFAFNPATITVKAGTTVTWTNHDAVAHTVTSDAGAFDSGTMLPGGSSSHAFGQAGTYAYHCTVHPSMKGTVTVTS